MLSDSGVTLMNTMVFGVAFISILIQVPMLLRYVQKNLAEPDIEQSKELNMDFETIQEQITAVNRLKLDGKISPEEYNQRIDEIKSELNDIICNSGASLTTKKIVQERASTIFASLPKLSPLHTIVDPHRDGGTGKRSKTR